MINKKFLGEIENYYLILSLCEDINLSIFSEFLRIKRDFRNNEWILLKSIEIDSENCLSLNTPFRDMNILFSSLTKEGLNLYKDLNEYLTLGSIEKIILLDGFPYRQFDTVMFIDSFYSSATELGIPFSIGVISNIRKFSYTDLKKSEHAVNEALNEYKSSFGENMVFEISNKISKENLRSIFFAKPSIRVLKRNRYMLKLMDIPFRQSIMKEMTDIEFLPLIEESLLKYEKKEYSISDLIKKIQDGIMLELEINELISFQRKNSFEQINKKVRERCQSIRTIIESSKNKSNNRKKINELISKSLMDEIHYEIDNEFKYWTNEK